MNVKNMINLDGNLEWSREMLALALETQRPGVNSSLKKSTNIKPVKLSDETIKQFEQLNGSTYWINLPHSSHPCRSTVTHKTLENPNLDQLHTATARTVQVKDRQGSPLLSQSCFCSSLSKAAKCEGAYEPRWE